MCCYDVPRDFSALRQRIRERYQYEYQFADALGLSKEQLSSRLNSKYPFTVEQIIAICSLLDIPDEDIGSYFRVPMKQSSEPLSIRGIIKAKFGTEAALAKYMGMHKQTLFHRLNFHSEFRYSELAALAQALELSMDEIFHLVEMERRYTHG